MEIKYLGHSSFLLKTKDAKVITDPFDPKFTGLKFYKQEADIVSISHDHKDHSYLDQIDGSPLVLTWPGQFEKKGVRVWGTRTYHDKVEGKERGENVMYKFEAEGVSVLHCGDLGVLPTDAQLDEVGDVHVLMVPVGDFYTIDAQEAVTLIKKIEPTIVIPMHYGRPEVVFKELAPLSDFLQKMGLEKIEPEEKLVVKREDFINEQAMRVVVLK